jgi:c-di-GMP-binding flagellar brake protein YcgR
MSERQSRVNHYRRSDLRAADKELITEIVVENSDTARFLKRMEETRLQRPCFQTLDMRGKVLGECVRYVFNDRVHYLDEISYAMFMRGLQENNGVFTVGTFESIIFGAHTMKAMQAAERAEARAGLQREERRRQRYVAANPEGRAPAGTEQQFSFYNPALVTFGYYRMRREGRLQYAAGVMLSGKGGAVRATTRDISVGGVQVAVKGPCPFLEGQEVEAHFIGLESQAERVALNGVRYRIARLVRKGDAEATLGLCRLDREQPKGFSRFLGDLVERFQRKYKLDVEDEYLSALALHYERCYARAFTQIPLFVGHAEDGLVLQTVALTDGNQPQLQFFSNGRDSYDLQPLGLPHRLRSLAEGGTLLLALYRAGYADDRFEIHSAADTEFDDDESFRRFLRFALSQQEHCVVRLQVENRQAQLLDDRKVDQFIERLSYKSAEDAVGLRRRLQELAFTAVAVDVTQQVRDGMALRGEPDQEGAGPAGLHCWVGDRQVRLEGDGICSPQQAVMPVATPDLVRFGYAERRREDRYLVTTTVQINQGRRLYRGSTRDISTGGMCVQIEGEHQLEVGQEVRVGLVKLQQKKSSADLMNIPYRVVAVDPEPDRAVMLQRVVGRAQEGLSKFFVELITKNRHKLAIDVGDIWSATASRIYEGLLANNVGSLPFFIGRNEHGVAVVNRVAVPQGRTELASFFVGPDSGYELFPIGDPRMIAALSEAIQTLHRQSAVEGRRTHHAELELYLFKEPDPDNPEDWVMRWATELEFDTPARREAFIREALEQSEFRFVKLVATYLEAPQEKQLEQLLEPVRNQSKHRALRLGEELRSVFGFGELFDITEDIAASRSR